TLENLLHDDLPQMKGVATALNDSAALWSRFRAAVADGEVPAGLDITPALGEAVQFLERARTTGIPPDELLAQTDVFSGAPSPAAEALLRLMFHDDAMRRPVAGARLTDLLKDYAGQAMQAKAGPGVLGAPETRTAEILRTIGRDNARVRAAAEGFETAPEEINPARPARPEEAAEGPGLFDDAIDDEPEPGWQLLSTGKGPLLGQEEFDIVNPAGDT